MKFWKIFRVWHCNNWNIKIIFKLPGSLLRAHFVNFFVSEIAWEGWFGVLIAYFYPFLEYIVQVNSVFWVCTITLAKGAHSHRIRLGTWRSRVRNPDYNLWLWVANKNIKKFPAERSVPLMKKIRKAYKKNLLNFFVTLALQFHRNLGYSVAQHPLLDHRDCCLGS